MRISDWSSDVCSSDLRAARRRGGRESRDRPKRTPQPPYAARRQAPPQRKPTGGWDRRSSARASRPAAAPRRNRESSSAPSCPFLFRRTSPAPPRFRSDEHTSELQSLMRISYAVFCLKKKKYVFLPITSQYAHN